MSSYLPTITENSDASRRVLLYYVIDSDQFLVLGYLNDNLTMSKTVLNLVEAQYCTDRYLSGSNDNLEGI